jgi:serine/threonine protein kinase
MENAIIKKLESEFYLSKIESLPDSGQSYSFKSFDSTLNRDVFVKVYWFSEKYSDTLLAEPRRLSTLFNSNPNCRKHIANIYDVSKVNIEEEDYLVLKMEYCGNMNIGGVIRKSRLSVHEAIDYAKQLCEGLHFLHSVNILHRDIKPENLILNNGVCKLIDFGSTTRLDEQHDYIENTSIKTLNYTPPEYFKNGSHYGKFSDIYQIGLVLHEMLNDRITIKKELIPKNVINKHQKQFNKEYKDFNNWEISELEKNVIELQTSKNKFLTGFSPTKPWIPNKLTKIIKTITHNDPTKRPLSCVLLRNQLSNLVIPNWKKLSEDEFIVTNWKNKDYKIYKNPKKNEEWILESSRHMKINYRKNSTIKTFESAIEFIDNQ